ncbi:Zn-ribbon domain-containing OB-fold protein [Pseudonocardia parietis]|uniref:OB-fold protein n=1 Tax=Pseudonocardia parietis TaxID=570936 RepID=A0ABS4W0L8_9PSEU|nr:OB-fold domain-containing protein [Pseudonocardia parietis]MBP2369749.1 putative OB-fold protein [Pseudonocardia parietis]
MTAAYTRPGTRLLPDPTPESEPFWTGGANGDLLVHRCRSCTRWFHPPAPVCFRCRSLDVGPEPASGRGRVAAFTINRQPWIPAYPPPYVVAMIELADEPDVRLVSNVVDVAPEDVHVGLTVDVFFEQWDDVWIPLFRPVGGVR